MIAATAVAQSATDPLAGLVLGDVPKPEPRPGWSIVRVAASSLNMHDLWTLRGVGHPPERLPIVLGCDAAGYDEDGNEVLVHPVIADPDAGDGDETLDPGRALLSERHNGAFAEYLSVPTRNLVPKPSWLTFDEAACLPVAWGTAYRMLFTQAQISAGRPGAGAGRRRRGRLGRNQAGGGRGCRGLCHQPQRRQAGTGRVLGCAQGRTHRRAVARAGGCRGGDGRRGDLGHSMRSLRPGGTIVIAGATSGITRPQTWPGSSTSSSASSARPAAPAASSSDC